MQVADFGCGPGFYSVALAEAVGPNGRVWALDVQKEMLELVRSKARRARFLNVIPLWADLEKPGGSKLAEESVDAIFMSNILFQTQNKKTMLSEAFRVLKTGGKIAIIDWSDSAAGAGPRAETVIKRGSAEKILEETGFTRAGEFPAGDYHYGLIYKK